MPQIEGVIHPSDRRISAINRTPHSAGVKTWHDARIEDGVASCGGYQTTPVAGSSRRTAVFLDPRKSCNKRNLHRFGACYISVQKLDYFLAMLKYHAVPYYHRLSIVFIMSYHSPNSLQLN